MNTEFGKKMSPAKKAMRLKYRKNISLQEAWDEVLKRKPASKSVKTCKSTKCTKPKKLLKKSLDKLSLKKLLSLSKKHKVSVYKKGSKVVVKKSTLLKRMKKSKSIKKILESASKLRSKKSSARFGGNPSDMLKSEASKHLTQENAGKMLKEIELLRKKRSARFGAPYVGRPFLTSEKMFEPVKFGSRFN